MNQDWKKTEQENARLKQVIALYEKEMQLQKDQIKLENLISSISRKVIKCSIENTDEIVNYALAEVGRFTEVDRSYLFLFDNQNQNSSCTHEWCAKGILPQRENLQNIPNELFPWWFGKIFNNEIIHLENLNDIPDQDDPIREVLARQSILSLLVVPVQFGDVPIGFIGFDSVRKIKKWNQEHIRLLQMMADIFAGHFNNIKSVARLRKSEEKYRLLMESTEDVVLVLDENGTIHYVNHAACRDYEKSEEELLGSNLFNFYDEAFACEVAEDIHKVIALGELIKKEYFFYYNSVERWYDVRIQPLFEDDKPVSKVMVFAFDVHEHKVRELRLEEMNRQIQHYNENLEILVKKRTRENIELMDINETIVNASGAMLISANEYGIIERFNPMAELLLGYKSEEVVGKLSVIDLHAPEEIEKAMKVAEKKAGKRFSSSFSAMNYLVEVNPFSNQEVTYVAKSGRRIPVLLSVTNIKSPDQHGFKSVGVAMDISKIKRAETALKMQNELKSRFVSMASHEFRTPLATILMAADSLDAYFLRMSEDEIHKKLGKIKGSVDFLKRMMERILDLSCIESGRMNFKTERGNFVWFFKKVVNDFLKHNKPEQEIFVHCDVPDIECYFDSQMMKQVILNLLDNAIKYSSQDSSVFVTLITQNEEIVFSIRDEGVGIPEQDRSGVFDAFYRGINVEKIRGTGLGLPLAREFVRMHKGDIVFESESDKGTTFWVKFPAFNPDNHFE